MALRFDKTTREAKLGKTLPIEEYLPGFLDWITERLGGLKILSALFEEGSSPVQQLKSKMKTKMMEGKAKKTRVGKT